MAQVGDSEGKAVAVNWWHEMQYGDIRYAYHTLTEDLSRRAGLLGELPLSQQRQQEEEQQEEQEQSSGS